MAELFPILVLVALAALLLLGLVGLVRISDIRQDLANARAEQANNAAGLRGEVGGAIGTFRDATQKQLTDMAGLQQRELQRFGEQLAKIPPSTEEPLASGRVSGARRAHAV